jgi:protein O-mannosyl-transferase
MGHKKFSDLAQRRVVQRQSLSSNPGRNFRPLLKHGVVATALSVLVLFVWSNSFSGGFVLDNHPMILDDPRVHEVTSQNVGLILNHSYLWSSVDSGLYRPFTTLSYLFNYAILGNADHPAGYHWLNTILHALNVFLVYVLALRLLRKFWPAVFVAAVWAVHPVLTESVTNIIGRADLLACLAMLSGMLMYLKSTDSAGWRKAAWLAALLVVTTVGVFSKESGVAILGVIVLYELAWRN